MFLILQSLFQRILKPQVVVFPMLLIVKKEILKNEYDREPIKIKTLQTKT